MKEEKSENAYVNGNGKIHFSKKFELESEPIKYEFNRFYYEEILKLLLNVFEETITIPGLKIHRMFNNAYNVLSNMHYFKGSDDLLGTTADNVVCEFECYEVHYVGNFFILKDRCDSTHYLINFTFEKNNSPLKTIGHELLKFAFHYTYTYKKGCFEINFLDGRQAISYIDVNRVIPSKSCMEKIFVRNDIK